MKLAAYVRMSTGEQIDSPETQIETVRRWCAANGHELVVVYEEDAISATKKGIERRPVLFELMRAVKDRKHRQFDGLIVWRLDRLAAEPGTEYVILGILDEHKCAIFSTSETIDRDSAHGRLVYHILMGVRALEREVTGERVWDHNMNQRLRLGRYPGGCLPLGLRYDRESERVVPDDRADDAVAVFEEYISALGNAEQAARALNRLDLLGARGKPWTGSTVKRTILSPAYRREFVYSGERVPAPHAIEAVIPDQLLARADQLTTFVRTLKPRQIGSPYAYSGLLTCSECGHPLIAHGNRNKGFGWICKGRRLGLCSSMRVANRYVDRLMGKALLRTLSSYQDELVEGAAALKPRPKRSSAQSLREARARIIDAYIDGVFDKAERDRRLADVDARIAAAEQPRETHPVLSEEVYRRCLATLDGTWEEQPLHEQRELLLLIGAKAILNTGARPLWLVFWSNLLTEPFKVALPRSRRSSRRLSTPAL